MIDLQHIYCEEQAETTVAAHDSTNILKLEDALAGLPLHTPLKLIGNIIAAVTSGGAATVQFKLLTATDLAFTSPIEIFDSGALALAAMTAGYEIFNRPIPAAEIKQFRKIEATIGTAVLTAGSWSFSEQAAVNTNNS